MNQSLARFAVVCDHCSTELGEYRPEQHKNITVNFPKKETKSDGTESYSHEAMNFCSKSCLANFLDGDKASCIASYSAEARILTLCDQCKRPINMDDKDEKSEAMVATLKGPDGVNKNYHMCSESCLGEFLNKRVKTKKTHKAKASVEQENHVWSLDISADENYLNSKKV
jgi:YHS domain-containing protein